MLLFVIGLSFGALLEGIPGFGTLGGKEVEIRVQDRGMGIPAHQQARIFARFMRADNAQAFGICGMGLGLYLSRALVEQHAGRLWFESGEGKGTTFFVRLPFGAPFASQ